METYDHWFAVGYKKITIKKGKLPKSLDYGMQEYRKEGCNRDLSIR
jgi:hypothetical protein